MLSIRFLRTGRKHQPSYKIVVVDKRQSVKSGKFIEQLGFYNPLTKEKGLNKERINYWLSVGAKPSDTVHNLLVSQGIIRAKKIAVHSTKKNKAEETPAEEEKPTKEEPTKEEAKKDQPTQETKPAQEEPKQKEEPKKEPELDKK